MPQERDSEVMPIALGNTQLCKVRWLRNIDIFGPHIFLACSRSRVRPGAASESEEVSGG